ncbi:uncharacterized protein LOC123504250 isoform X2 [Portunus trituberculatus]|uniref:uncharacterized protein LOC123504250 isoform X2 n=1 Tax=Portunus trituberculatus TaxID=210409 RepID=UPI001E1CF936|nr:uncharacterized protein LOC123504250 isoform X2 [Portunus trituberculatus]
MGWTSSLTYIRRKSGFKWRCDVPLLCSTAQHSRGVADTKAQLQRSQAASTKREGFCLTRLLYCFSPPNISRRYRHSGKDSASHRTPTPAATQEELCLAPHCPVNSPPPLSPPLPSASRERLRLSPDCSCCSLWRELSSGLPCQYFLTGVCTCTAMVLMPLLNCNKLFLVFRQCGIDVFAQV